MMVMTARVDFKKILMVLAIAAAVILAAVLLLGGNAEQTAVTTASMASNDARVQFLKEHGWEVTNSPKESSQVRIPKEANEVYSRYNTLQLSMGYDLSKYAGKNVMRYVYQINNYPGATEPVYATVLVYKNSIIGGDITNTAPGGQIHGFRQPEGSKQTLPSTEAPTEPAGVTEESLDAAP